MKTIYKYPLEIKDEQIIDLPPNHTILSVQMQNDVLCLWALVEPSNYMTTEVKIRIYGTGHPVDEEGEFLGTFQDERMNGYFVGHVFKV